MGGNTTVVLNGNGLQARQYDSQTRGWSRATKPKMNLRNKCGKANRKPRRVDMSKTGAALAQLDRLEKNTCPTCRHHVRLCDCK